MRIDCTAGEGAAVAVHDQHIHVIYVRKHKIINLQVLQNKIDFQMGWQCVFCDSWTHLKEKQCQKKGCKLGRRAPDPKFDRKKDKDKNKNKDKKIDLSRAVVVGNYTLEAGKGCNYGRVVSFPSCTIKEKVTSGKRGLTVVTMDEFKDKDEEEVFPSEWIKPHVCLVHQYEYILIP